MESMKASWAKDSKAVDLSSVSIVLLGEIGTAT